MDIQGSLPSPQRRLAQTWACGCPNYQCRSPRIVAWARAAFEQGALPSLLMMPGIAPVFSLPGDRMFQATGIMDGQQPLTSRCYLPVFLKGKNYLYSRAGNSGTPLGSRALPCPNGLLELMLTLDRMGATPLPT